MGLWQWLARFDSLASLLTGWERRSSHVLAPLSNALAHHWSCSWGARKVNTLFVNLYGGPGSGKSTTAARVFSDLKSEGYNAELVTEYAKELVWGDSLGALEFQPYVTSKQAYRQYRLLKAGLEVVVTDSPLLLGAIYQGWGCDKSWEVFLVRLYRRFNNLNIFIERDPRRHLYNPSGRLQTEMEAIEVDMRIKEFLARVHEPCYEVTMTDDGSHARLIEVLAKDQLRGE